MKQQAGVSLCWLQTNPLLSTAPGWHLTMSRFRQCPAGAGALGGKAASVWDCSVLAWLATRGAGRWCPGLSQQFLRICRVPAILILPEAVRWEALGPGAVSALPLELSLAPRFHSIKQPEAHSDTGGSARFPLSPYPPPPKDLPCLRT